MRRRRHLALASLLAATTILALSACGGDENKHASTDQAKSGGTASRCRATSSSTEEVTAETFKFVIEHDLHPEMQSPAVSSMSDVVGAEAYIAGKAKHISGITRTCPHSRLLMARRVEEQGWTLAQAGEPPA